MVALFVLAALPGAASAANLTSFELTRQNSNPEFTFVPNAGTFAGLVASPLAYPASNGFVVGLGTKTGGACTPAHPFVGPSVSPNATADDCDAFLRTVDGRHEDSPGGFPGLHINSKFLSTGPAPTSLVINPPRGQLGSPYSAHQCVQSPANCSGLEPAFSAALTPLNPGGADEDPTEADGAKLGGVTFKTKTGVCQSGCSGEIINYDARALTNPDERGAPSAQALVLCEGPLTSLAPGLLPTFCAGNPLETSGIACGHPGTSCVIYAQASPIDVVPAEGKSGDYQLRSAIDFTKLVGAAAGEQVVEVDINEFGLILQSPLDPRQDPNKHAGALPFIFNPTSCITAISTGTAQFADGSTETTQFQTFPNPNDAAPDANERAWVENECSGFPWNNREVDPAASSSNNVTPFVTPANPTNNIVTREQPTTFNGNTRVLNFDKFDSSKSVPVETPSALAAQFTSPTRGGLEYQSHYSEIHLLLKDTSLSPALAGRPGFTTCSPEQFDAGAFESASCPEDSKIADLKAVSPLADGVLGPVPCNGTPDPFTNCSKVNPFVYAENGCFDANANPEAPCDNLTRRFSPADWAGHNPGANLDPIPGDVWAGPQVKGHPNQFRIFAQLHNTPDCVVSPSPKTPASLCAEGVEVRPRLNVKLQGIATANLKTGEIDAVFGSVLPQLPVFDITQAFNGGDFAPLVTPSDCGDHKFAGEVVPWAGARGDGSTIADAPPAAQPDDTITTHAAPNAPCSGPRSFQPELSLFADPFSAAQDTKLTTTIKLPDRSDNLTTANVSLPDGALGALGTVPMCGRDKARAGDCPTDTQIGTVDVQIGNGGHPIHTPGKVYFSQPGGAGELARITVVVPAKAGPFDLGETIINELAVKLRVKDGSIGLDNVGQDKLPTIIAGIPIRLRQLDLVIDHPRFFRNPVTCDAKQATGTFGSAGGQTASATAPFTATGCENLAFTPNINVTVGTPGNPTTIDGHPPVSTVVTQPDHEAAILKSVVSLPQGLNPNVVALSVLCSADQLAADTCPPETRVGFAKAFSPLLVEPLAGPVYISENPGGLPKLAIRLGGLLSLDLTATSALQGGRLVTTLNNLPATPVSRFELNIDGGPRGLFTASPSLCSGHNIDGSFDSHTGQHAVSSNPAKITGPCGGATTVAASRRPAVSVRVSRLGSQPTIQVFARKATGSAANLSSLRLALPKGLVVVGQHLKRGVSVMAAGKRLAAKQWHLSRLGVLTVRGLPKSGRSNITVSIRGGAIRAGNSLRGLAARQRALPRVSFTARVVDVKNTRYSYTVRVRPTR